jgi:hypothetical protein
MKVGYVAGPFRAANYWEQEQNVRRAEALALEVWKLGCACICPHANTRFYQGACPDGTWLTGDWEILGRCDFIILVEGWRESSGTRGEVNYAYMHGRRVFEKLEDLKEWLKNE